MRRFTYWDKDLDDYAFEDGVTIESLDDWAHYIGLLEDFKEEHEPCSFREYLIDIRKKMYCTQEEFARRIHIDRSTIASYESGRIKPPKIVIAHIANNTDMAYEWVMSAYRKFEYNIDDEYLNRLIAVNRDDEKIAIEAGRLLTCEREFAGVKKKDLAKALKMTTNTITQYESGKRQLTWAICRIIAYKIEELSGIPQVRLHDVGKRMENVLRGS